MAAELHTPKDDALAAALVHAPCCRKSVRQHELVLHADNDRAMRGKTMLARPDELGIMPLFSRPRVSDGSAFVEAFFRTLKHRPNYSGKIFPSSDAAKLGSSPSSSGTTTTATKAQSASQHRHSATTAATTILSLASSKHKFRPERSILQRWTEATRDRHCVDVVPIHLAPKTSRCAKCRRGRNSEQIAA